MEANGWSRWKRRKVDGRNVKADVRTARTCDAAGRPGCASNGWGTMAGLGHLVFPLFRPAPRTRRYLAHARGRRPLCLNVYDSCGCLLCDEVARYLDFNGPRRRDTHLKHITTARRCAPPTLSPPPRSPTILYPIPTSQMLA